NLELDPNGQPTYFAYNGTPFNRSIARLLQASRATYFSDQAMNGVPAISAGYRPSGYQNQFNRQVLSTAPNHHDYKINYQVAGASATYFIYDSNSVVSGRIDPNGNTTLSPKNARERVTQITYPDSSSIYFVYADNNTDLLRVIGSRNATNFPQ